MLLEERALCTWEETDAFSGGGAIPPVVLELEEGISHKSSRNLAKITLPVGVNPKQTFLDAQDSLETPQSPACIANAHHTLIMGNWSRRWVQGRSACSGRFWQILNAYFSETYHLNMGFYVQLLKIESCHLIKSVLCIGFLLLAAGWEEFSCVPLSYQQELAVLCQKPKHLK